MHTRNAGENLSGLCENYDIQEQMADGEGLQKILDVTSDSKYINYPYLESSSDIKRKHSFGTAIYNAQDKHSLPGKLSEKPNYGLGLQLSISDISEIEFEPSLPSRACANDHISPSLQMLRRPPPPMGHPPHHFGGGHTHVGPPSHHQTYHAYPRKRSRPHDELQLDLHSLQGLTGGDDNLLELTPHGRNTRPQPSFYHPQQTHTHHTQHHQPQHHPQQLSPPQQHHFSHTQHQQPVLAPEPQQHHHHHRLPNQPPPNKMRRIGYAIEPSPPLTTHGPPSVVGQEGMPPPAARPRGPKLKFTSDDDQLLVDLKEKKNLTWKQIADFFPGRSSGTLQVRYCTKLKAKTTVWTEEMIQKLRTALREYDNDRWRIISTKVGSGFSPAACKEKANEVAAADREAGILPPEPDSETDSIVELNSADAVGPPSDHEFGNGSHGHNLSIESVTDTLPSDVSRLGASTSEAELGGFGGDDGEGVYGRSSPTVQSASSTSHHTHDFR